MSVEILDGKTVQSFVEDESAFNSSVDGRFAALDTNRDGLLSYSEMAKELMSLRVLDRHFGVDEAAMSPDELVQLYRGLYARFDHDGNGTVDLDEFRAEMKEVMLAVANGLGFLPVQMVVEEGSFLKHQSFLTNVRRCQTTSRSYHNRGLYARFDHDGNGTVDLDEFRAEMKEVMLAVANGIGFLPVQMVVEEGSFLKVAVDRELAKAA
ncbi:hypothetical protein ABZP36_033498 [Zizania latifolia]